MSILLHQKTFPKTSFTNHWTRTASVAPQDAAKDAKDRATSDPFAIFLKVRVPLIGGRWYYNPPIGSIYTTYILPSGGLYATDPTFYDLPSPKLTATSPPENRPKRAPKRKHFFYFKHPFSGVNFCCFFGREPMTWSISKEGAMTRFISTKKNVFVVRIPCWPGNWKLVKKSQGFCVLYCWCFRNPKQPPGMYKNRRKNNGINYQAQLVIAGFLNHQLYFWYPLVSLARWMLKRRIRGLAAFGWKGMRGPNVR